MYGTLRFPEKSTWPLALATCGRTEVHALKASLICANPIENRIYLTIQMPFSVIELFIIIWLGLYSTVPQLSTQEKKMQILLRSVA